jgi:hypothetical protein
MSGPESILTKRKGREYEEEKEVKPKLRFDQKIIGNVSKKIKNDNPDEYEYEEMGSPIVDEVIKFSPPPSPLQLQFGPEPLVTYTPDIYATHSLTSNFAHSDEYTDYFKNFLEDGNIECNDSTQIQVLLDELVKMFKMPEINKQVIAYKFFRKFKEPFRIKNKLGSYKRQIRNVSSDGLRKNYFYVYVVLKDIPIPNAYASASASTSANSNSDSNTDYNADYDNNPNDNTNYDPHDGGSRKRRKSGKKKTIKRRRKTIRRRKTGKKRKTNKRRK